jgi:hypothetical protein
MEKARERPSSPLAAGVCRHPARLEQQFRQPRLTTACPQLDFPPRAHLAYCVTPTVERPPPLTMTRIALNMEGIPRAYLTPSPNAQLTKVPCSSAPFSPP